MKVIIIGAGIAGLTAALAFERAGIEVKLYDKANSLRHIGGGILLWPYAIRYLEWLEIANDLPSFRVPIKSCHIIGTHGKKIFGEDYANIFSLLGGEILPLDRSLLQQTLLAQLKPHTIQLGRTCIAVENKNDHAQVIFGDGTKEIADLVIGADGIHSTVRKYVNEQAVLEYTNNCWFGGIVEQKYVPSLAKDQVFVALGHGKMCVCWPTFGDHFMWYIAVKMPANELIRSDDRSQLFAICADWHQEIHEIINAPACSQSFQLAINTLPPQTAWYKNRVALIGDAAHALGPILGQGANQAIEDVFVLSQCLQNMAHDIQGALNYFQSLRQTKIKYLSQLENHAAALMVNDDIQELAAFQDEVQHTDLATMYQDLIPLVNENACHELASAVSLDILDCDESQYGT